MAAIPKETLDSLIALGRSRGHLTTEDLAAALPVEAMAPDEIALVVVHLEDAGIPVEIDESLLGGRLRPSVIPPGTPEFAALDKPQDQAPAQHRSPNPTGPPPSPQAETKPAATAPRAHTSVILAGILVAVLLALLLYGLSPG
jgi:hypothetical protein